MLKGLLDRLADSTSALRRLKMTHEVKLNDLIIAIAMAALVILLIIWVK